MNQVIAKTYKGRTISFMDLTGPKVYRIEHATRGNFVEFRHNDADKYIPRFSQTGLRSDPKHWSTRDLEQAVTMLEHVSEHVPKCYLLKMTR